MIAQVFIALTGAIAIWLAQSVDYERRRWACLVGLAGQPFWIYSSWEAEAWGMFAVTLLYTAAWSRGAYDNWWLRAQEASE